MSDWIIEKFLDVKASHKQIVLLGEIIKRDLSTSAGRISKILSFIIKNASSDTTKSAEELKDLFEIISFFHGMTKEVKVEYSISSLDTLLDKSTEASEEIQELVLSFIVFLFELNKPLKDGKEMTSEEIISYLISGDEESGDKESTKFRLASTLCASSKDLSSIIVTREELLDSFINIETTDLNVWKSKTRFWYNCAQEDTVRKYLTEKDAANKIFSKFRQFFGPKNDDNASDEELNKIIVSFLSKITAGNEETEKEIAASLKEDLTASCENDRIDYLNSIVVPLLHSEDTIPITLSV